MMSESLIEKIADSMMEFMPSMPFFDRSDPSGYKWARNIAENCAKAAIAAMEDARKGEVNNSMGQAELDIANQTAGLESRCGQPSSTNDELTDINEIYSDKEREWLSANYKHVREIISSILAVSTHKDDGLMDAKRQSVEVAVGSSDTLSYCPFCGGKAEYYNRDNNGLPFAHAVDHWISCTGECGASTCMTLSKKRQLRWKLSILGLNRVAITPFHSQVLKNQ